MVTGSFSIMASASSVSTPSGASAKLVRRLPSDVFWPNSAFSALISSAIRVHCLSLEASSDFSSLRSLVEGVVLAPDLHLLEFAQSAQAHIEDRFGLHVA